MDPKIGIPFGVDQSFLEKGRFVVTPRVGVGDLKGK